VLSVLAEHSVNVIDMVNKSRGELGINLIDAETAVGEAVVAAIRAVPHVVRVRVLGAIGGE
jgi:D-3-phosphoglycerate dehydrogenase